MSTIFQQFSVSNKNLLKYWERKEKIIIFVCS